MQFDQAVRRATHGLASAFGWAGRRLNLKLNFKFNWSLGGIRGALGIALIALLLIGCYYIFGAYLMSKVDTDLKFQPPAIDQGGSQAVAMTAALIDREANRWVPNDPIYKPSYILHNMPSFQRGMLDVFQRFTISLNDQLGRTRGSSPADSDLELAAGDIRYGADRWVWNADRWWAINLTAEDYYRRAAKELRSYNKRVAAGQAAFDPRTDNLKATLDGFANDLGATSAAIDEFVSKQAGWPLNVQAAEVFYRTQGELYGCYMILSGLRSDASQVLKQKNLDLGYAQMLQSLADGARLHPFLILNASPDSQIFPNHLMMEGFYLLLARTRLREITTILQT
jgi:Uncharacterized protein conserved in bacteria (DUF2333)